MNLPLLKALYDASSNFFQLPRAVGIPVSQLVTVKDPTIAGAMIDGSGQIVVKKE